MKNTLREVIRSPKFVVGFVIMALMMLFIFIYPLVMTENPMRMLGLGTFFKPGTYVSMYDAIDVPRTYTLNLSDADIKRLDSKLLPEDRVSMRDWLVLYGVAEDEIDIENTEGLMELWWANYSEDIRIDGMISATRRMYVRLNNKLAGLFDLEDYEVTTTDPATGEEIEKRTVKENDYLILDDVANVRSFPLGTDNFGRDVLNQLVHAAITSLQMGLMAGALATLIGLILGLFAGYVGGWLDDVIMFILNIFTVIPGFVLLILISYSVPQSQRGPVTVALVIGCTSWVWTARSVRSQVISLRNRDHVNLSKLSGRSLTRIIMTDILPYIASYVVMAFILQISNAILAEAQLSMLGLGPKTTETFTLGLMMNWAMLYTAHINGAWWAYYPVLFTIALISFSLNLMNTGLDQVFNPQLRS